MNATFSFNKYSGIAAACVWALGWAVTAMHAVRYLMVARNGVGVCNLIIPIAGAFFGIFFAVRFFRRRNWPDAISPEASSPEPWYRRISGWIGTTVWCAVAIVWNLCVFHITSQAATKGQSLLMAINVPFSIIGGYLLLLLFTAIGLSLDLLFQIKDETVPQVDTTKPTEPRT